MNLWHQEFIRNAFVAGTLVAVLTAIIGYFVVMRSEAFAAHALSHIGFAGATGAALLGINSLIGMLGFTAAAAVVIGAMEKRLRTRHIEIGMVLAFSLGLGVLFLHLYTRGATEAVAILFGSILSVDSTQIRWTLLLGCAALAALAMMFRPLTFASIDPQTAEARGIPVRGISVAFMLLLAITVAVVVQVVGILLMFALLIAPPAIAMHLFRRPITVIVAAALLGIAFTWFGLLLAIWTPYPVSFYIAGSATVTYLVVVTLSHLIRPHRFRPPQHPERVILR
jgi:zinc/manganese transport system permease protein